MTYRERRLRKRVMAKSYYAIEVSACNWRNDGRRSGPKPRASVWGIGSLSAMRNQANAVKSHYGITPENEQSSLVVIEVLPVETAEARYSLYV